MRHGRWVYGTRCVACGRHRGAAGAARRRARPLSAWLYAALAVVASPAAADSIDGAWSPVFDWPLISVHAAVTPDLRVLTYGTNGDGKQTGYFIYDVWDPAAGPDGGGHLTLDNVTLTDIFCSSQVILPQSGEIFIAGGDNWTGTGTTNTGNNNSNLFDSGSNSLTRAANMNRSRWYSSSTVLANGEIYVQGGSSGGDLPEVRQLDESFRLLTGAPTGPYAVLFPRNFLAPDGRVFGYDTSGKMYYVATAGSGALVPAGQIASANAGWTSSAAMYRPGKILQIGGNSNGALIIDINGPQPSLTTTQSMSSKRMWVSATVLADGSVLATGGSAVENQLSGVNNSAEIWDPLTGEWHVGVAGARARLYHSSAILLPDASVLVAGGGAPGPLVNTNAEIYYPPYLFNVSGGLAARPQILSAPVTANAGDVLNIETDATDIVAVNLVKTSSVTHSVNMDQRFVPLSFTTSGNMVAATLPARASDVPPGYYLMFALNAAGTPSTAHMLRINIDPDPFIAVDYTPAIGGGGGAPFQLACASDEVLVGVHGTFATYVNQIGPYCVRVDQFGRWIGDAEPGARTGNTATGTDFDRLCPRDFAVSGFEGRAGQYVNQLNVECRALTPGGGLTGAGQLLGADGGNGGGSTGLERCGTGNPVYALYGRSGGWLDSFGMQCRVPTITPIAVNSTPVVVDPGPQTDIAGIATSLQIEASDGDDDALSYTATGLPPGLTIGNADGLIAGTPVTAGIYDVEVEVSDGSEADTATFAWTIEEALPLSVEPMAAQPPLPVDTQADYTAVAQGGVNVRYKWQFGDGTPETAYSASSLIAHTYTAPGVYYVTLTVSDDLGSTHVQTFVQAVHLPVAGNGAANSTDILFTAGGAGGARLWTVNRDNDSVSVFDAQSLARIAEIGVGASPRTIARATDGRLWVTNMAAGSISVIDAATLTVVQTIALAPAGQPWGIVFSPVADVAFVSLQAGGRVLKLDGTTGATLAELAVGRDVRHLAVSADGGSLYASRFVTPRLPGEETAVVQPDAGGQAHGGEVLHIDTAGMLPVATIVLEHSDVPDAENQGSGVPNYVAAVALSPDGTLALVPSKQDNVARGVLRSGTNINFQNTVRAIASVIDLAAGGEAADRRLDFDNASVASAAVFDPLGIYAFVALETSREVSVVDVHGGFETFRVDVGRAPQGVAISDDGLTLYVSNFMDRTVTVLDLTDLQTQGLWNVPVIATLESIDVESLPAAVLRGKQLFYDARDTRLARDRYLSCATCHNDGGHDGRVWDLTGMGEGLRNTIDLRGRGAGQGALHWSRNFDEVQDFEGQIRGLAGGTGLMADADFNAGSRSQPLGDPKAGISADLDDLAAYVASLTAYAPSPFRASDGKLTSDGEAGRQVFRQKNCAACHGGADFTDSASGTLHDVGTIKASSGQRLGGSLTGIDTPTLRGVWSAEPYLHDGSAETLAEAVAAHDGISIEAAEMIRLVAYLAQVDGSEATAPAPNTPPVLTAPGAQSSETGEAVSLVIEASDADGDVLSYAATGLPEGLSMSVISGEISGTPSVAGQSQVTVTVDDGEDSVSESFSWTVLEPNTPPVLTAPGAQSSETGEAVSLVIEASDADGDVLSYAATGLPEGLSMSVISGEISGTPSVAGQSQVTVTVADQKYAITAVFVWTITESNMPPTIVNPGPQASERGDTVNLAIIASDPNADTLTFSATGLPVGVTIDAATGLVGGIPSVVGRTNVTVVVDDGEDSVSENFIWTITDKSDSNADENGGGGAVGMMGLLALSILTTAARFGVLIDGFRRSLGLITASQAAPIALRRFNGRRWSTPRPRPCVLAILAAAWIGASAAEPSLPRYDRVRILDEPRAISTVELIDRQGNRFALGALHGDVALVFFGFTHCPDVCPTTLARLRYVEQSLPGGVAPPAIVMISVDGERDTPDVLDAYLDRFSADYVGLTGTPALVGQVAKAFRAPFYKGHTGPDGGGYLVSHTPQVFVLDPAGRLRAELYGASVDAIAGLTTALREGR